MRSASSIRPGTRPAGGIRPEHRAGDARPLEKRGLVERDPHPTDARKRTVVLTAKGKRTFRRLWTAGESIRQRRLGVLQPDEADALAELLARVAESLNADGVSVGGSASSHSPEDER